MSHKVFRLPSYIKTHSSHDHMAQTLLDQLNTEERLNRLPLLIILGILSFVGVIANIHILYIFGTKFKSSTYRVFVLSLGIIDILGSGISIPFQIFDESHPYTFDFPIPCKIFRFFDTNLAIAAALMLVVIALERFRKICRPQGPQMTELKAIKSTIFVVIGSSIVTSPALLIYGRSTTTFVVENFNVTGTECSWDDQSDSSIFGYLYYALELFVIVACMVCLSILYIMVGNSLRVHRRHLKSSRAAKFYTRDSCAVDDGRNSVDSMKTRNSCDSELCRNFIDSQSTQESSNEQDIPNNTTGSDLQKLPHSSIKVSPNHGMCDTCTPMKTVNSVIKSNDSRNEDYCQKEHTESSFKATEDGVKVEKAPGDRVLLRKKSSIRQLLNKLRRKSDMSSKGVTSVSEMVVPDIVVTDCSTDASEVIISGRNQVHSQSDTSKTTNRKSVQFVNQMHPQTDHEEINRKSVQFVDRKETDMHASTTSIDSISEKKEKKWKRLKFVSYFRKKSHDADSIRERRITKLLFLITLTFIVTFSPYIAILVVYAMRPEFTDQLSDVDRVFYLFGLRLYLLNYVLNAFYYGFFDLDFRNHCKEIYVNLYRSIIRSKIVSKRYSVSDEHA